MRNHWVHKIALPGDRLLGKRPNHVDKMIVILHTLFSNNISYNLIYAIETYYFSNNTTSDISAVELVNYL